MFLSLCGLLSFIVSLGGHSASANSSSSNSAGQPTCDGDGGGGHSASANSSSISISSAWQHQLSLAAHLGGRAGGPGRAFAAMARSSSVSFPFGGGVSPPEGGKLAYVQGEDVAASAPFVEMWRVTDIAWPSTQAARNAYMENAKELLRHGARVAGDVDVFNILPACSRLGIRDMDSVGLVLWSGPHPRRHDGKNKLLHVELQEHLKWSHSKFLAAALDMLSSSLPQATVIACDKGNWADNVLIPLDHKPLCTFRTRWGKVDGSRFHSEASGFDGRHVRPCDTDQFVGCGLVAPLLQPFVLGQKAVDIPELAALVAEAGLHVLFVGEYTCAQSRHCLRRALADRKPSRRMLCDRPWKTLPKPQRGWKRGADQVYSLQEFREEASPKVKKKHAPERWPFKAMHAASNWLRAVPRGRAGVSDFGHTMWPAAVGQSAGDGGLCV